MCRPRVQEQFYVCHSNVLVREAAVCVALLFVLYKVNALFFIFTVGLVFLIWSLAQKTMGELFLPWHARPYTKPISHNTNSSVGNSK